MGVIIRMNGKTFQEEFRKNEDVNDFQYVVISQNITTEEKFKNVKAIPRLVPPPTVVSQLIDGGEAEYRSAFLKFAKDELIEPFITIIVRSALHKDNLKIVLLCSEEEDQFNYLKLLCEYIEEVYKLKTYSYKKYKKDPKAAEQIKNLEQVTEIVGRKIKEMEKDGVDLTTSVNKSKIIDDLKTMGNKKLRKLAEKNGIKFDEDTSRKKIIKKLTKKIAG
ncbi:hypothetical protein D1872_36610 [compost metagenome]